MLRNVLVPLDGSRISEEVLSPVVKLLRSTGGRLVLFHAVTPSEYFSVTAAQSIWNRLVVAAQGGGDPVTLSAPRISRTRQTTLRRVGLSERKGEYLRDLARHFVSGRLDPSAWPALDDEALIEALTEVKGIGRWTAEMFLIFHELRADVLPVADIGLQNAMARHYFGGQRPPLDDLRTHAQRWQPYRSVATWYLWRSLDPVPVEY